MTTNYHYVVPEIPGEVVPAHFPLNRETVVALLEQVLELKYGDRDLTSIAHRLVQGLPGNTLPPPKSYRFNERRTRLTEEFWRFCNNRDSIAPGESAAAIWSILRERDE